MKLSTSSLFDRRSMKYLLLDLTIISLIILTAARKLLASDLGFSFLAPECDDAVSEETNVTISNRQKKLRKSIPPVQLQEYDAFKIDDVVEVYDPKIVKSSAFFGQIVSILSHDDGSIKFNVITGPEQDEGFQDIDLSSIRVHEPYEFNTRAICDFGSSLLSNEKLFPCTILAADDSSDVPTYHVLGTKNGKEMYFQLPIQRVRRLVVDHQASSLKEELENGIVDFPDPTRQDVSSNIVRGIAEIYDGDTNIAQPAIITSYRKRESKYSVYFAVVRQHVSNIEPEMVHPYKIYPDGTSGLCNVAQFPELNVLPCVVHSHSFGEDGMVSYQVSYDNGDGEKGHVSLPYSRMWRDL